MASIKKTITTYEIEMGVLIYILSFLVFFFLHYVEGLPPILGLPVAQLWKLPIMLFLVVCLLMTTRPLRQFEKYGYLYSLEPFLSQGMLSNPVSVIIFAVKQLPLILFYNYWYRFDVVKLEKFLLCFAQFICLASLVTLLGIVEPLRSYGSADGFVEDMVYYSSVFGAPHAASSYFSISIVVILFYFIKGKFTNSFQKVFNGFLLLVAMYSLFLAYVRTGWLMLLVSSLFLVDFKRLSQKGTIKLIMVGCTLVVGLVYFYNNNDAFRLRVSGGGQYRGESEHMVDISGSGRTDFWMNGIKLWLRSDTYPFFFGRGYDDVIEANYRETGMRVFSHNLFIDTLTQYGLCGFLLLLTFLICQYLFICKYKRGSPYGNLCFAIFIGELIFGLFQSEMYFNYAIVFSLALVLMFKTSEENQLDLNQYGKYA